MRTLLGCLAGGARHRAARLASAESQGSLERAIKATYLYKFAPFVEWPMARFDSPAGAAQHLHRRQRSLRRDPRPGRGRPARGRTSDSAVAHRRARARTATSRSSAAPTSSLRRAWARCAARPSSPSPTCRPARPRTASSISSSKRTTCGSISTTPRRPRTASASVPSCCSLAHAVRPRGLRRSSPRFPGAGG